MRKILLLKRKSIKDVIISYRRDKYLMQINGKFKYYLLLTTLYRLEQQTFPVEAKRIEIASNRKMET